jgi:TPP-dependent pyruvate/acetoin dehydrogenase alpha subunit
MLELNTKDLKLFEEDIASLYEQGNIRGAIHLRDGNEDILIKIFKDINTHDYVYSTWANHLHALLKGVPPDKVKQRILDGNSMAMNFPEYRFYTSAIVGGICPIAVGTAYSIKRSAGSNRVHCFLGDMAFRTGIAHESIMYSLSHDLPITFVIEDNGKSVGTPTQESWGTIPIHSLLEFYNQQIQENCRLIYYEYNLKYPHSGTGTLISF